MQTDEKTQENKESEMILEEMKKRQKNKPQKKKEITELEFFEKNKIDYSDNFDL